jgi:transposase-like protein
MASGVETYVKVKGRCMYLYRAVDSRGRTIDFLLSAKRDTAAAKRFFRKALMQPRTLNPRTIALDKNAAYPKAAAELKRAASSSGGHGFQAAPDAIWPVIGTDHASDRAAGAAT